MPGVETARLRALAFGRPARVVHVGGDSPPAQLGERLHDLRAIGALLDDEEHVDRLGLELGVAEREEQALDSCTEADSRRRRPADRLDQPVVAPAAADRALRADRLVPELERRARVVVEAPDERRLELVTDAGRVEERPDLLEVRPALVAEALADRWCLGQERLNLLALHVEDTQRRRSALGARLFVEVGVVLVEPGLELLEVRRPTLRVPDRVEVEGVGGDTKAAKQLVVELDQLRVDGGIVGADRLDGELPVLAVPALLRPVVAPHRAEGVELHRLRFAVHAVLEVGAADRGRRFGTERQRAVTAVLERVGLLLDDVGALARGADEELGVLEARGHDPAVAVERAEALRLARDALPERLVGREDVVRSSRRFELQEARSSARKGLCACSVPSVVGGPWPG